MASCVALRQTVTTVRVCSALCVCALLFWLFTGADAGALSWRPEATKLAQVSPDHTAQDCVGGNWRPAGDEEWKETQFEKI